MRPLASIEIPPVVNRKVSLLKHTMFRHQNTVSLFCGLVLLVLPVLVFATPADSLPKPSQADSSKVVLTPPKGESVQGTPSLSVTAVRRVSCGPTYRAALGDEIQVVLNRRLTATEAAVRLMYINGFPMRGLECTGGDSVLYFGLVRNNDPSDSSWSNLYCNRCADTLKAAVALGDDKSILAQSKDFSFILIRGAGHIWAWMVVLILIVGFIYVAKKTDLLRETNGTFTPDPNLPLKKQRRGYSLARSQLAFWTMIIASGYIFIWLSTGAAPRLFDSTLALMGISIAATAGARIIDVSQNPDDSVVVPHTDNWLQDIISDNRGVNLHRFQMVVWTMILGLLFILHIVHCYSYLDLSTTQLLLLGIGSATYVGLKIAEAPPTEQQSSTEIKR